MKRFLLCFILLITELRAGDSPQKCTGADTATSLATLSGSQGEIFAINNAGQTAGWYYTGPTTPHAVTWSAAGAITDLTGSSYGWGVARAISPAGYVGGEVATNATSTATAHPFYWDGTLHELASIASTGAASATAINDSRHLAGFRIISGVQVAFFYDGSSVSTVDLGGGFAAATAINTTDQVVGFSKLSNGKIHAFLLSSGTTTDLGTLGGDNSIADTVTDTGVVTGESQTSNGTWHTFVYSGGVMTDIGRGGRTLCRRDCSGINRCVPPTTQSPEALYDGAGRTVSVFWPRPHEPVCLP